MVKASRYVRVKGQRKIEDFSGHLLQRLHREAISAKRNSEGTAEGEREQSAIPLNELMSYPGVSEIRYPFDRTTQNTIRKIRATTLYEK